MNQLAGIYKIQSKIKSERCYVGSSKKLQKRIWKHRTELMCNKHYNLKLQRHVNKYGFDDLSFEVIEKFEFISKEHLLGREQYYLDLIKPYFNVLITAGSPEGITLSRETRKKLSDIRMGMKFTEEHCQHIKESKTGENNPNFGKKQSKEWVEKRRKALFGNQNAKGCNRTEEQKRNAVIGRRKKSGYDHSIETRKKLRESHLGVKQSPETIAKRNASRKKTLDLKKQIR